MEWHEVGCSRSLRSDLRKHQPYLLTLLSDRDILDQLEQPPGVVLETDLPWKGFRVLSALVIRLLTTVGVRMHGVVSATSLS